MGRGVVIAGVALIAVGGAALGFGLTRKATGGMTPEATSAMGAAVATLDGDIKVARASVDQRARTLSQVSAVRATVGTDAETTKNMIGREIAFQPEPGEVIELGQIRKDNGKKVSLAVIPDDSMRPTSSGTLGAVAELIDTKLLITQTVAVVPSDDDLAALVDGFVTVSRPLDLEPSFARLVEVGLSGRIEVEGKQRAFGTPPANDVGEWRPVALTGQPGAQLVVAVPPAAGGMPIAIVAAGAGSAALGLVLLLIGMMGGRDRTGHTQAQAVQYGATMLSGPGASGTPSPVGSQFGSAASSTAIATASIGAGAMIGRWQVVRRLGSGGMADVFLAHAHGDAGFEKVVALKVMHQHLARMPRAVEHFLDEARLAARVTHPNVVQIQDLGKIGDDYVIVMEYVEGVDLERMLASARLAGREVPLNVALGILMRICDGVHAAHTATAPDGTPLGIIHRDVKSANVLVSKQGGVKVVDFGIAKAATQIHMTVAGETKGTPSMMAPEQRVGEQVDVRADVYSIAAVSFEVLTGHAVNLDLAALAHLGVENWPHLPAPSSLRANLPPELDPILLGGMAFERERRPANCVAFEATLEAVMKQHNLSCSDKDVARWVEAELAVLAPTAGHDATASASV